jgi:hypothetical protein
MLTNSKYHKVKVTTRQRFCTKMPLGIKHPREQALKGYAAVEGYAAV